VTRPVQVAQNARQELACWATNRRPFTLKLRNWHANVINSRGLRAAAGSEIRSSYPRNIRLFGEFVLWRAGFRRGQQDMFNSWMKLMQGGKRARREANLMVSEKIDAAVKAGASLMTGASGEEIVRQYRRRVAANAKRLGQFKGGWPVRRRKRSKRK